MQDTVQSKWLASFVYRLLNTFFYNQTLFSQNHHKSTLEKLFKVLETQVPIKHLKRACLLFSKAQDNFLGWALSLLILFDSYTDSSRYVDTQQNLWSIGYSQNKNCPSCANELLHLKWNYTKTQQTGTICKKVQHYTMMYSKCN